LFDGVAACPAQPRVNLFQFLPVEVCDLLLRWRLDWARLHASLRRLGDGGCGERQKGTRREKEFHRDNPIDCLSLDAN